MWSIARNHGIDLNELLIANPEIDNQNFILPGQIINIPINDNTYHILAGDTMYSIARRYNIDLNSLISANPQINNQNFILPGQTINIPSGPTVPSTTNDTKALESEVIRLVNIERSKVGQPNLRENNELSNVARIKSKDFIENNYFSHNSPTYGTPFEMLRNFGINFTAAAENLASGQRTASEVMNSWMNSPTHRANILSPNYNQIGVGVAKENNNDIYWTQMFIRQ